MISGWVIRAMVLIGPVAAAGCTGPAEPIWATDAEVARAEYIHDGPAKLTLFTVISNRTDAGAHSALMVNATQRVIFDPAGTWHHPQLPERNDVHYGMTDAVVEFYVDYHSRITYRTVIQEVLVTPEVARIAMNAMMAHGAVPKAQCSRSVTAILAQVPGFRSIGSTWFPKTLSADFGALPGVSARVVYDNDPDKNTGMIQAPPVLYAQTS